jgi:transitional endoplasmic reticulum ATPase
MIELPLKHPELFDRLGIDPPKGVLLHGPPGTGKTLIAKAVANESGANFYTINGPEIMSKFYGQSEENLRKVFEEAQKNAPSIVFLDEIDAIAPKRSEVHGEVERRVVSQLLTLMDGLTGRGKVIVIGATNIPDVIDPALRRPGRFDREIRIDVPDRNGRKEILLIHTRGMPINPGLAELYPGETANEEKILNAIKHGIKKIHISDLLRSMLRSKEKNKRSEIVGNYLKVIFDSFKGDMPSLFYEKVIRLMADEITNLLPYDLDDTESNVSAEQQINERLDTIRESPDEFIKRISKESLLDDIADITYGFVGADLAALAREAAMNALRRYLPDIDLEKPIPIELLEKMEVTLDDFKNAHRGIEPSALREFFVEIPKISWEDVGGLADVKQSLKEAVEWPLTQPEVFKRMGIHAPRGILLYGPPGTGKTLLAKAVAHESKANFISIKGPEVLSKWVGESEKAVRELFKKARQVAPTIVFLDEIDSIAPRRGTFEGSHVTESVVNQLLTSIDGLESMEGVVVIGATNRPDIIDPGLLRPGRFDRLLLIPAPDSISRLEIFKIHTKDMPLAKDVSLDDLAEKTIGYSGADIDALCREAAMIALRGDINVKEVRMVHFEYAMGEARGSLTEEVIKYYKKVKDDMGSSIAKKDKKERDIQYM